MIVEVNEDNFLKEVLNGDGIVVVDCYSPLCLPCVRQDEILGKLAGEYKNVKFCKFNTDTNPELADKLKVNSVPTLLFISGKDGNKIEVLAGLKGEEIVKSKLEGGKHEKDNDTETSAGFIRRSARDSRNA